MSLDDGTYTPLPDIAPVRLAVAMIAAVSALGVAPVASAGPTCEDRAGEAVRCTDPRAMPLGWTPPLEERLRHPDPGPPEPTPVELGGVFTLIILFFALIALMPDFDGWSADGPEKDNDDADESD